MMNRSKRKGDDFERSIVHAAEARGLKAYRNRMSLAPGDETWDVAVAGKRLECKKRGSGFKMLEKWMGTGCDGLVIGADRAQTLVVLRLEDYLGML